MKYKGHEWQNKDGSLKLEDILEISISATSLKARDLAEETLFLRQKIDLLMAELVEAKEVIRNINPWLIGNEIFPPMCRYCGHEQHPFSKQLWDSHSFDCVWAKSFIIYRRSEA